MIITHHYKIHLKQLLSPLPPLGRRELALKRTEPGLPRTMNPPALFGCVSKSRQIAAHRIGSVSYERTAAHGVCTETVPKIAVTFAASPTECSGKRWSQKNFRVARTIWVGWLVQRIAGETGLLTNGAA